MERRLGPAVARTRFVGYTDRPEDFMAAADVFCLPSYREGFGMVIIEAAAAGSRRSARASTASPMPSRRT
jgi:glycosyltransferase involved in cell wall biosynthesis